MSGSDLSQSPKISIPSTKGWFIVHIFLPLIPFFLGGIVRIISNPKLQWNTFNAAELALSMGLISLFVSQSLWVNDLPLLNQESKEEMNTSAQICLSFGVVFVVLFAIVEVFNTLINDRDIKILEDSLHIAQTLVFILSIISIIHIVKIQRGFKLRARIS